jgi:hypothetical protein
VGIAETADRTEPDVNTVRQQYSFGVEMKKNQGNQKKIMIKSGFRQFN